MKYFHIMFNSLLLHFYPVIYLKLMEGFQILGLGTGIYRVNFKA